jgi:glucose dehydrogenase
MIGPDYEGGFLLAYDAATGQERWRVPGGTAIGGGTVATAGNLVFQAVNGSLYAYSADKGEKLMEIATGVPGQMAPPMTFLVDGKQYVALQVGTGRVVNPAAPPPAANATPAPVLNPQLLVYTLDGKAEAPKAK